MSRIREATPEDAARVAEIYRPYVENTAVTFETVPPDEAEMRSRIVEHLKAYPYLVMEEDGRVVGYAYAGAFHERRAYRPTVELSVYMDEAFRGAGRGEALVRELPEGRCERHSTRGEGERPAPPPARRRRLARVPDVAAPSETPS